MDPTSISAALSSLKAARDIAKAMLDLKVGSEVQLKVIELQSLILAAQEQAMEAQERMRSLEAEMQRIRNWESESERYELRSLGEGKLAYRLRDDKADGEPQHWICPNCFQDQQKSILQREDWDTYSSYRCQRCNNEIHVSNGRQPPPGVYMG